MASCLANARSVGKSTFQTNKVVSIETFLIIPLLVKFTFQIALQVNWFAYPNELVHLCVVGHST